MATDQMIGGGRQQRRCAACGKTDDHPRDLVDNGDPSVDINYHIDCHANLGCESCAQQIQGRPKNATGAALLEYLVANAPTVDTKES